VFNYFTGILKVTANPNKMKRVASYIEDVVKELDKQVLIEAKLVEVVLNDSSAYGINWSGQLLPGDAAYANIGLGASVVDGGINLLGDLSPVGVIGNTGSLTDWFAFMASHGRIESIGNPRVRVMNGQSAMISSGQLIPYWEAEREEGEDDEPDTITYSRVTVLDGVVMGVTAHVKEDESITLNIVPVFSDVEQVKTLMNANGEIVASYPIVNLKEAGTVLNVTSGDTIVMGGLISNVETDREEKIPVLGDIPVLGNIFKGKSKVVEKRELVIFLKTTIIER
jgi:MSHA biogenesis protein MshL